MNASKLLILAALAAPAAFAQGYYYSDPTLTRDELRDCMARDSSHALRQGDLQRDQAEADRAAQDIASNARRLAEELRALDNTNLGAVASYNSRSAGQNQAVEAHNRRVAQLNARAARLNEDLSRFSAACVHPYHPRDRDAILYERGHLR